MVEYYIPNKKEKLSRTFFARPAERVAKDLLGRFLVVHRPDENPVYTCLYEVAAFEGGSEESMTKGSLCAPGTFSISTKHGKRLIDIATLEICRPSCVTLIAGMVGDGKSKPQFFQGPGNLAKRLSIGPDYAGVPVDFSERLWLGGEALDLGEIKKRNLKNAPLNCKGYFYLKQ